MLYIHKRTLYADTPAELLEACRRLQVQAWRLDPGLVPAVSLTDRQALLAPGLLDARFAGGRIREQIERRVRRRLEPRRWKYAHALMSIIVLYLVTSLAAWGMWA